MVKFLNITRSNSKKSQTVAYIALFLVLLILGFAVAYKLVIMIKSTKEKANVVIKTKSDPRTDVVYLIKKCIKLETEKALYLAAKQGNVINISKWKNNGKFIYWFYWNESFDLSKDGNFNYSLNKSFIKYPVFIFKIPSLEDLKEELEPYLKRKIKKCINQFKEVRAKYNIIVLYRIKNISVTFYNKTIKVNADIPITIYDPINDKVIRRNEPFLETLNIPYKEDYENLVKLFKKIQYQGLYGYYILFLSGLTDKIPYGVLKLNCNGISYDIKEIKRTFQFLLNNSDNICYSNCKFVYSPFNSFERDLKLNLPDYYYFLTNFYKIKYFDAYLRYEKNASERYSYKNNYISNNIIYFKPITPEEYTGLDDLEFKGSNICSGQVFYDLIVNGSILMSDKRLRNPLVFNIAFDTGLMNNRPITLASSLQPENRIQYYYVNRENNTFTLWPRRAETVYFFDNRGPTINYNINLNLNFKLANLKSARDVYLEIDPNRVNDLKDRLPNTEGVFCLPFYYKQFKSNKIPLAIYCSKGTIALKNRNYSALINIQELHKNNILFDNFLPSYLTIKQFNQLFGHKDYPKKFLENFGKKEEYIVHFLPINKQIIDIYNNETLFSSYFNDLNTPFLFNSILSPKFFNPLSDKYIFEVLNTTKNVFEQKIKKKMIIYYNNKKNEFSKFFIKEYLYGTTTSLPNSSFNLFFNETQLYWIFGDTLKYVKEDNTSGKKVIPISIYGIGPFEFKRKINNNIVFPLLYDYYGVVYNSELTKAYAYFKVILDLYDSNFQRNINCPPFNLIPYCDALNKWKNYFSGLVNSLENGYEIANKKIEFNVSKEIKEYFITKVKQAKYICQNKMYQIHEGKGHTPFYNCILDYFKKESLFNNGIIYINNFRVSKNESETKEITNLLDTEKNPLKKTLNKYYNCIKNINNEEEAENCAKILSNTKLNFKSEEFMKFLSNPPSQLRQRDFSNIELLPYFGKEITYNVKINIDPKLKKYKKYNHFSQILISKLICNTDNGKKEVYLSNFGLDNFKIKTYIPYNCVHKTKFIYKYFKPKLKGDLFVDPSVYSGEVKEFIDFIKSYNDNNVFIQAPNLKELIENNYYIYCPSAKVAIITNKDLNIPDLDAYNNIIIINLGNIEKENCKYKTPDSPYINNRQKVLVCNYQYYTSYNGSNKIDFIKKSLITSGILEMELVNKTMLSSGTNYNFIFNIN